MFDLVKQQVSLLQELEKDLGVTFRSVGEKNWRIDGDKDVESCPFCGHHDCFRAKHEEGDYSSSFYKCFSCGERGDIVTWRSKRKGIKPGEATRELAREAGIRLPNNYNPIQQIFNLAADYYHNCLTETCNKPYPVLNGLSPIRYQTEIRNHKRETLDKFKIGYSDGGLVEYLDGIGIDRELVIKSGLISSKTGKDFLPGNCFIYPHFVKGQVSHFTFKDPLKRLAYQLPKKFSLNGYLFYGQDNFSKDEPIFLVEGENDFLSVAEAPNSPLPMAMIGQISSEQIDWLKTYGKDKRIITVFDPDTAGDGYRQKLEANRKYFKGLVHVLPPDEKDIDKHLSEGAEFIKIITENMVKVELETKKPTKSDTMWEELTKNTTASAVVSFDSEITRPDEEPANQQAAETRAASSATPVLSEGMHLTGPEASTGVAETQHRIPTTFGTAEVEEEGAVAPHEDSNVIQRKGCYYKVTKDKDGDWKYTRLSDFTLELTNVYEDDLQEKHREVVLIRMDGYRTKPFMIDSETKVTARMFKILIAKFADCEWLGKENELDAMWRLVYNKAEDVVIRVTSQVGKYEEQNCWIFKNLLITGSGVAIEPDANGVFWPNGRTRGIKPASISSAEDGRDIPALSVGMTREETEVMLGDALMGFAQVLKDPGPALMALGWIHSNVYSNEIFKYNGGMGSLMFWGTAGKGKSTLAKWLQRFYGLGEKMASTSVQQLRTGIGFMRKAEYYASLPMFLDELRADELSNSYLGMIRSWYDREGRTIADKNDTKKVLNQKIRATLMIGGEDLPEDPATKERCIMIRVPPSDYTEERLRKNYDVMENISPNFSNITYFWILDACNEDISKVMAEIRKLDGKLVDAGCSNRISKVWAGAAYFALKMAEKYFPEYDFIDYLVKSSTLENSRQKADNTLARFFEVVEIIHAEENSPVNDNHISVDGREPNLINIWYPAVFKEVNDRIKDSRQRFSKHAILRAIREEPYFVSEDRRVCMGMLQQRRCVLTLDLSKAPEPIRNLAMFDK